VFSKAASSLSSSNSLRVRGRFKGVLDTVGVGLFQERLEVGESVGRTALG
jgi:hypothetical protein